MPESLMEFTDSTCRMIPASPSQAETWDICQAGPEFSSACIETAVLRFTGDFDRILFNEAVSAVVNQHDILRSSFNVIGQNLLVGPCRGQDVRFDDLSALKGDEVARRRNEIFDGELSTSLSPDRFPLIRVRLLKLTGTVHEAILLVHRLVCDARSLLLLIDHLSAAYSALVRRDDRPLQGVTSHYSRFVRVMHDYLRSADRIDDRRFWQRALEGELQPSDPPTDASRPPLRNLDAGHVALILDDEVLRRLLAAVKRCEVRSSTILYGAFLSLLSRYTGQTDLLTGFVAQTQDDELWRGLIGPAERVLPMRTRLEPGAHPLTWLRELEQRLAEAFNRGRLPFEEMFERSGVQEDPSRSRHLTCVFHHENHPGPRPDSFAGVSVERLPLPRLFEHPELLMKSSLCNGRLLIEISHARSLISPWLAGEFVDAYEAHLADLCGRLAEEGDATFAEIETLSAEQRGRLFGAWNETGRPVEPADDPVMRIRARLAEGPDQPAVVHRELTLTRRELDALARSIRGRLEAQGVIAGDRVGILLERSPEMLAAVLACLDLGATWVPLDPTYPKDRLAYCAEDAGLAALVTSGDLGDFLDPSIRRLAIDSGTIARGAEPRAVSEEDLARTAYLIYTSGSTGQPKGVAISRRALANFLTSMAREPGFPEGGRLLAVTTLSFDISILELLLPLIQGGTVVIADPDVAADGRRLRELLDRVRPTMLQGTPATWRLLLEASWPGDLRLKALCGGEPLPAELVAPLLQRTGELWNMYGPTETTVWSTCRRILDPREVITVGGPIDNTRVYLLDATGRPAPLGAVGEVCIAGLGVAEGYRHLDDLTAERFLPDRLMPAAQGPRLYRTGDLGRWREGGVLQLLGRSDSQVKLRGYRIELGEIETNLGRMPGIKQSVVAIRQAKANDPRLVAWVVPDAGRSMTATEVRKHLRQTLPEYMIPHHVIVMEVFPRTSNGKVDRVALPDPDRNATTAVAYLAPRTPEEIFLAELWSATLGANRVSRADNFFQLGGHSLLATRVVARIEERYGRSIDPRALMLDTLEQIAANLAVKLSGPLPPFNRPGRPPVETPPEPSGSRLGSWFSRLVSGLTGGTAKN